MDHVEQLEKEIRYIKNSLSYKVGRLITFPARKIYDFFERLFKKHTVLHDRTNLNKVKFQILGIDPITNPYYESLINLNSNSDISQYPKEIQNMIGGLVWPTVGETMIGLHRMNNVECCVEQIIKDNIEGDFIETGVWKGGTCIYMRALLKEYKIKDKIVWVADSFEGLPKPNEELYPADKGDNLYSFEELSISLDSVKSNFMKYDLLDDQVKFLKGWFKDTLPSAPIEKLSLLRLDGDMYESTMDALINLYPKLQKGGFIIIDDYGCIPACRKAVSDYRDKHNIANEIIPIDWTGAYWQK